MPQTVSRLLESGFLKQPPAWYEAVTNHPPVPVPARQPVQRPDEDLPLHLRSSPQPPALAKAGPSTNVGRDATNSKKKSRSLTPKLIPKPIVYEEDKVRQQFFRDHPWEAYRPKTLVEMSDQVGSESRVHGDPKRLRSYGRNPSVEDFVACTLAAHRQGGLSLSQAYHNTLSSYHGLKAEHEHATRYALLEAKYLGADMGKSETQRGFEKEDKALESWAVWAAGGTSADAAGGAAETQQTKAARVKRTDQTFTAGDAYLDAAKAFREGKVDPDRLTSTAQTETTDRPLASIDSSSSLSNIADDFLGLARSTIRSDEVSNPEPSSSSKQS